MILSQLCIIFHQDSLSLSLLNGSKNVWLFIQGQSEVTVGVGGSFWSVTGEFQVLGKRFGVLC